MAEGMPSAEHERLSRSASDLAPWRIWGPYVSGRQWGTVREDYSADGDAWSFFPFDQAHRRAYRWGEDGIAGICDRYGFLNLAIALWNGHDDRLKERWFGLTNGEGNHGEDVKEYWWHVDATPTHSYGELLYRYPHAAYPYDQLREESRRRTRHDPEFELLDSGVLDEDRFFDVTVIHAKARPDDIVMEVRVVNRGPEPESIDVVPQLWFRNTWAWGRDTRTPVIRRIDLGGGREALATEHAWLGRYVLVADGDPRILLCDNETNLERVFGPDAGTQPASPKDAIDDAIVHHDETHLADAQGTKAAIWWHVDALGPGEERVFRLRLLTPRAAGVDEPTEAVRDLLLGDAPQVIATRRTEADEFYSAVLPDGSSAQDALIARRAFAGLLWGRQLYRYDVRQWLSGDPAGPAPPQQRRMPQPRGRNTAWTTLSLADVISMPDEWEYPWFASWDLAFHCVALAHVDPAFAKEQLVLMCREWAMHPSGQLPAYEWNFSDVNPPVHAWAAWHVYVEDGGTDREFLVNVFTKLLLNFGWWVNRKDPDDSYLFEGGFLGMDNIGPFDRSEGLPDGQRLEQSDATSWMAFFCLGMLTIAIELAREDRAWDGVATKFLEHFLSIAEAMETFGSDNVALWDDEDGFYYDVVVGDAGLTSEPVRVRSMVGLLPLLGVAIAPAGVARALPDFARRLGWLVTRRPDLTDAIIHTRDDKGDVSTLTVVTPDRLRRVLSRLLDEGEFLAPGGIRALSAAYRGGVDIHLAGHDGLTISYVPGESDTDMFGGNSNWRGPIWFPVNCLLLDALRTYAAGLARDMEVELPTGSGRLCSVAQVVDELEERLIGLFRVGADGRRPSDPVQVPTGPLWQAHPTFSEYFHGDTGAGLGASHQTGWTAMVAHLICRRAS